uniref:Reverse transcriptase domain-containing protein n=1 Tax=Globodera pallida TaxID=36090 RepID=A0A183CLD1_GLOPA
MRKDFSFFYLLLHIFNSFVSRSQGQFESGAPLSVRSNPNYDGRALTVPMDLDGTLELYQHWMDQAFTGMFAAVANQKITKSNTNVREKMERCSKQVTDVISHANCLSKLLRGEFETKKAGDFKNKMQRKPRLDIYKAKDRPKIGLQNLNKFPLKLQKNLLDKKYGEKFAEEDLQHHRIRRQNNKKSEIFVVKTAPKYFLRERTVQMSPLGAVAQLLTKSLMAAKNKTEPMEWQNTVEKIRLTSKRRKSARKQKLASENEPLKQFVQKAMDPGQIPFGDMDEILERGNRTEIRQIIRQAKRQKSARSNAKNGGKMDADKLVQLVRQGVTLGFALAGENTTGWDEKTMRIASPRFLSVVAEDEMASKNETLSLLSPSLFSMHDDGQGIEKSASLPSLFRQLNLRDQQQWLNLIMEAAGINEQAKKMTDEVEREENDISDSPKMTEKNATKFNAMDLLKKSRGMYEKEIRGEDGQPLYFTRQNVTERYGEFEGRKIDLWEKFMGTFSEKQNKELNRTGFVPMRAEQLRLIYGVQSPFNDSEALHRLASLNESQIRHGMERDIHNIARLKQWRLQYHPDAHSHSRRRRAVIL